MSFVASCHRNQNYFSLKRILFTHWLKRLQKPIVCSTICSGRSKKTSKLCVTGRDIHRWQTHPHKRPVTWKMFSFDDVIRIYSHPAMLRVSYSFVLSFGKYWPRYNGTTLCLVIAISVPKFEGATVKPKGWPTASGFDVFSGTFDGELQTCSDIILPVNNDRRKRYELKFSVPPISYVPGVLSWTLIVKFLMGNRGTDTCHYPGMTVYVDDARNANVDKECPRRESPVNCEFRCSGYKGLQKPLGNQPDVLRLISVRLEVPMYGDWPVPVNICEIKTRWEPETLST